MTLVDVDTKSILTDNASRAIQGNQAMHVPYNGRLDVNFSMKVTGLHSNSLDRQVTERVNIENFQGAILMNRRNEMGGVRVDRVQYRRWGGD